VPSKSRVTTVPTGMLVIVAVTVAPTVAEFVDNEQEGCTERCVDEVGQP
jgi:hypothetical protein